MTNIELCAQYKQRATDAHIGGCTIEINYGLPCVAIYSGPAEEYFFQGTEAEALLATVPDWINANDYLLAVSQDW